MGAKDENGTKRGAAKRNAQRRFLAFARLLFFALCGLSIVFGPWCILKSTRQPDDIRNGFHGSFIYDRVSRVNFISAGPNVTHRPCIQRKK